MGGSESEIQAHLQLDSDAGLVKGEYEKKSPSRLLNNRKKNIFQTLHGSPKNVQVYPTQNYPAQAFQSYPGQSTNASPVASTKTSQHSHTVVSIRLCIRQLRSLDPIFSYFLNNAIHLSENWVKSLSTHPRPIQLC